MQLTTPLARVRGHGSAKDGTRHWWGQRLSAVALVPLSVWAVAAVIGLIGADYEAAREVMRSPWVAALWILFVASTFYHGQLGLQVVIEDYVHREGAKLVAIIAVKMLAVLLSTVSVIAILRLAAS